MDMSQVSLLHHVCIILCSLAVLSYIGRSHPLAFVASFFYFCLVNHRYTSRLRRRIQFEAKMQANQKRVLSDSESAHWLNHAVAKVWPICMERIASQQFLLPIIPWFLDKYKPWTARKAVLQHLFLGRNPPMFTEIRVLGQSADDDDLVLELGMSFLSADDMNAVLAVKLRKGLGFGMWVKMHVTGMHIEGKVLVGIKFLENWPYIGRVRLSFVEIPYFQMTVKPIFSHGLDVTELPGIAGWLDNMLSQAFEQSLVEPNMLVVDMKKFASTPKETWFKVDEKHPVAYAKLEIMEGADMKPSDMNGLADPYVKGQLGLYRFRTKIKWKTLAPKWFEEFRIPIVSWDSSNTLALEVRDKDRLFDDALGDFKLDIGELRGGQRHERWLSLQNIKRGKLRLAVTVLEGGTDDDKMEHRKEDEGLPKMEDTPTCEQSAEGHLNLDELLDLDTQTEDKFESIPIEGQEKIGIWVHHPGSARNVPKKWEPLKGKVRQGEIEVLCEDIDSSISTTDSNSSIEENQVGKRPNSLINKFEKGLKKFGSAIGRSPKNGGNPTTTDQKGVAPHPNPWAYGDKAGGVKLVVDDAISDIQEVIDKINTNDKDGPCDKKKTRKGILKCALGKNSLRNRRGTEERIDDDSFEANSGVLDNDFSDGEGPSSPLVTVRSVPMTTNVPLSSTRSSSSKD